MLEYVSLFFHNFYSNQSFNQITLPYYTGLIYHTHRSKLPYKPCRAVCFLNLSYIFPTFFEI